MDRKQNNQVLKLFRDSAAEIITEENDCDETPEIAAQKIVVPASTTDTSVQNRQNQQSTVINTSQRIFANSSSPSVTENIVKILELISGSDTTESPPVSVSSNQNKRKVPLEVKFHKFGMFFWIKIYVCTDARLFIN